MSVPQITGLWSWQHDSDEVEKIQEEDVVA